MLLALALLYEAHGFTVHTSSPAVTAADTSAAAVSARDTSSPGASDG